MPESPERVVLPLPISQARASRQTRQEPIGPRLFHTLLQGANISLLYLGREKADDSHEGEKGKILFKKPVKRRKSSEGEGGVLDASTKKPRQEKTKRRTSTSKSVKNSSLLSFGEEEEENG